MEDMIGSILRVSLSNNCTYEGALIGIDINGDSPKMRLRTFDLKEVEMLESQIVNIEMLKDPTEFKQQAERSKHHDDSTTMSTSRHSKPKHSSKHASHGEQTRVKQTDKTVRVRNEAVNTESTWMGAKFDGEFDFDGNLALFDKRAIYDEIDRGRSGTQSDNETSRFKQAQAETFENQTSTAKKQAPQASFQERSAFSREFARLPSVKDGQVYGAQDATFFVRKSESELYDQTGVPIAPVPSRYGGSQNGDSLWLTPAGLRVCTVDRATRYRLIDAVCDRLGAQTVVEVLGRSVANSVLDRVLRNEFTKRCTSVAASNGNVRNSPHLFSSNSSSKRSNATAKTVQSASSQTTTSKRRCVVLVLARANLRGAIALNCARHLSTRSVDCAVLYFQDSYEDEYNPTAIALQDIAAAQLELFEEADGKTARTLDDIRALQLDAVDCVVNALLDGPLTSGGIDSASSPNRGALSGTSRAILRWCGAHVGNAQHLLVDPPGDFDDSPELSVAPDLAAAKYSLTFGALDSLVASRCAAQLTEDSEKNQDTSARGRGEKRGLQFGTLLFADAGITKRMYEAAGFTFFQSPFSYTSETVLPLVLARSRLAK